MTTNFFGPTFNLLKAKAALAGRRPPVPVPVPGAVMVSRDGQSFVSYPSAAAMASSPVVAPVVATPYLGQGVPVSLEKKPADVETISLGPKATFVSTPGFDMMGTEEEKIGPRAKPASLVGGL